MRRGVLGFCALFLTIMVVEGARSQAILKGV